MSQTTQGQWTKQDLIEVARRQKNILWLILISSVTMFILSLATKFILLAALAALAAIGLGIIQVYFIYKLATALRSSAVWAYIILAFIPFVGWAALILISVKATKKLRENGIKVGLTGARWEDLY